MISEITMQRLAFIRYLYQIGVEQSQRPEPLNASSILTFHDSIELFLQLASEHLNVGDKRVDFIDYWDLLNTKLPTSGLLQKESMRRLNKSRVALKHHGTMPSSLDIEAFRASATNFFKENIPLVFAVEFDAISMINLVKCEAAKGSLEKANELAKKGNLTEALVNVAISFQQLIDDYEDRKRTRYGESPFFFGEDLTLENSMLMDIQDRMMGQFVDKVRGSITSMKEALKILSLELDYRRYVKFRMITPSVYHILNGAYQIGHGGKEIPASDDYVFCYNYVIESSIKLQEFDFKMEE